MNNVAIVTALRNVRPHPNADRVKLATCHGNQIVIELIKRMEGLKVELDSAYLTSNLPDDISSEFVNDLLIKIRKTRYGINEKEWL